jgi:hypothetical protein
VLAPLLVLLLLLQVFSPLGGMPALSSISTD